MRCGFNLLHTMNTTSFDEALKTIGADFEAKKCALKTTHTINGSEDFESEPLEVEAVNHSAIVRDNHVLGIHKRSYGLVQYRKIFGVTEKLIPNGFKYVGGYTLGHGEKAYITLTEDKYIDLGDGIRIKTAYTISSSHDGTVALDVAPTPYREDNGTVFTFPRKGRLRMKHSKRIEQRLATLEREVNTVREFLGEFDDSTKLMARATLTPSQLDVFLHMVIEGDSKVAQNRRDAIHAIYIGGTHRLAVACNNTLLGAYFAVVEWVDRTKTVSKRKNLDEHSARVEAMIDGTAAKLKAESYASSLKFMKQLGIK